MPSLCWSLLLIAAAAIPGFPQTAADTAATVSLADSALPSDPAALLELARKTNGLDDREAARPWELEATYQVFDGDGKVTDEGTLHELWMSPTSSRSTYGSIASSVPSRTVYITDHGSFQSGSFPPGPDEAKGEIRWLFHPVPFVAAGSDQKLELREERFGSLGLKCVQFLSSNANSKGPVSHYCFDPDKPMLRAYSYGSGMRQVLFNDIVLFRGRYLARDIKIERIGKPYVAIRVTSIGTPQTVDESTLSPPPDAKPIEKTAIVALDHGSGTVVKTVPVVYSELARQRHVQGVVSFDAVIGKDGHIADLKVWTGPPELKDAALSAVRQWVYKPYVVNGVPRVVYTVINVQFRLYP